MTLTLPRLDIDRLLQSQVTFYRDAIPLHGVVDRVLSPETVARFWVPAGIVRPTESLGFAVAKPELTPQHRIRSWDGPRDGAQRADGHG